MKYIGEIKWNYIEYQQDLGRVKEYASEIHNTFYFAWYPALKDLETTI